MFSGGPSSACRSSPWNHALYQFFHHPAASDVVVPHLERLSKEGEAGRKKITQYTRYGTVLLSLIQGFGISVGLERMTGRGASWWSWTGLVFPHDDYDHPHGGYGFYHVARRADHRAGHRNGISLIIFAGIVARMPTAISNSIRLLRTGRWGSSSRLS